MQNIMYAGPTALAALAAVVIGEVAMLIERWSA